ncbi:hypothetical protein PUN28_006333 [Cardiocondyla obscurior]|uniref:Secreted protein n=1 Tax=Cardiocondyla obscurior TaxID=286306 RepID=A0AAW2G869_9HYME
MLFRLAHFVLQKRLRHQSSATGRRANAISTFQRTHGARVCVQIFNASITSKEAKLGKKKTKKAARFVGESSSYL